MKEIWKDISDYEGLYQISNFGRVKNSKNHFILQHNGSSKYLLVVLYKNGIQKNHLVHRLVAKTFVENPSNLPQVNHKDENILNNYANNLEWCTSLYNQHYGTKYERMMKSKQRQMKRISQYDLQDNYIKTFNSISEAARELNGNRQNIIDCLKNKKKYKNRTAYGYKWKYEEVMSCR